MKIILGLTALLAVAASFWADYKWRQWMARRRQDDDAATRAKPGSPRNRY